MLSEYESNMKVPVFDSQCIDAIATFNISAEHL